MKEHLDDGLFQKGMCRSQGSWEAVMDVRIPRSIGIREIWVLRTRSEPSTAVIGYYDAGGQRIIDGNLDMRLHYDQRVQYVINNPAAFAARESEFLVYVDGNWIWGEHPGQPMERETVTMYADHAEVVMYTGANDEFGNLTVYLYFDRNITAKMVPHFTSAKQKD